MDLVDRLRDLAARIPKLVQGDLVKTEEGVKNALVMPFISQALGYDVFNPLEVTPELVADVGTKKGEKVDYAIMKDGKPIILFECKGFGVNLSTVHASQLYRYFSVTSARFGILTNGIVYRFYTDLSATNKMDDAPFFVFDLSNYNEGQIDTLKQFTKASFDEAGIRNLASDLKYRNAIRTFIDGLFNEPTDTFVRYVVKESKAYEGVVTQSVIGQFTVILRDVMRGVINDYVDRRLKTALASETEAPASAIAEGQVPAAVPTPATVEEAARIVTTAEENEAYLIVKSIVRGDIDLKRVVMKDAQTYCNILIDNNNRKCLARLYFNRTQKQFSVFAEDKSEEKFAISALDDIYNYADKLKKTAVYYATHAKDA
jgi:hypothetical protein